MNRVLQFFKPFQKHTWREDCKTSKFLQIKQMLIPANNVVDLSSNCSFEKFIIRRVGFYYTDTFFWRDKLSFAKNQGSEIIQLYAKNLEFGAAQHIDLFTYDLIAYSQHKFPRNPCNDNGLQPSTKVG